MNIASPENEHFLHLDNQLCFRLYAASKAIIKLYKPMLDELDLTYPQYLVLLVLWQDKNISIRQLGERLTLDSGTLSPLLKRLETKGYVNRIRNINDERSVLISLTQAGELLKEKAVEIPGTLLCHAKENGIAVRNLNRNLDNLLGFLNIT